MKIYNQNVSLTIDQHTKNYLAELKRKNINVSKYIRNLILKDMPVIQEQKPKKPTIQDLKNSLLQFENSIQKQF